MKMTDRLQSGMPRVGQTLGSHLYCLKRARVCRENRFLLEERDLMQQQFQQLAERSPSRPLGIGTQGSETPFGTPCTRGAAVVILLPCCRLITGACPTTVLRHQRQGQHRCWRDWQARGTCSSCGKVNTTSNIRELSMTDLLASARGVPHVPLSIVPQERV